MPATSKTPRHPEIPHLTPEAEDHSIGHRVSRLELAVEHIEQTLEEHSQRYESTTEVLFAKLDKMQLLMTKQREPKWNTIGTWAAVMLMALASIGAIYTHPMAKEIQRNATEGDKLRDRVRQVEIDAAILSDWRSHLRHATESP